MTVFGVMIMLSFGRDFCKEGWVQNLWLWFPPAAQEQDSYKTSSSSRVIYTRRACQARRIMASSQCVNGRRLMPGSSWLHHLRQGFWKVF